MEASNLLFVCVFITSGQTPAHGWSFSQSTKALKWKIHIPVASCGKILNVQSRHLVFPSCVVKSSRLEMTSAAQRNTNAQKGRWSCGSMRFTWALEILKFEGIFCNLLFQKNKPRRSCSCKFHPLLKMNVAAHWLVSGHPGDRNPCVCFWDIPKEHHPSEDHSIL